MPLAIRHPTPAALRFAAAPVLRPTSQAATPRNKAVELQAELRLASNDRKREFLQALRIKNAANHLRSLPEPNTSLHCVMKGNYNAWDLVPAFLKLCHPASLSYLGIATLGFNYRNAAQLIELIDSQQIAQVDFVCSLMYADHEKSVCQDLFDRLTARRSRFAAIRNHAKVMLFQTTADRFYTYEGSANLRSCRNIEQFSLTQDKQLFEFHRSWLNQVLNDHPFQPQTAVRPSHPGRAIKRAGPTAWAVTNDRDERAAILAAKQTHSEIEAYAAHIAALIRTTCPNLPEGTIVSPPPQGASAPGPYYALSLASAVASTLHLPCRQILKRTDRKRHHHPMAAMQQAPFRSTASPPCVILVDDLVTSGATVRLCFQALKSSMVFAFAYSGC